jgi:hypothetical protein
MMSSASDVALLLSQSVELSLLMKATVILLAGLVITHLTRTARASVRHLVVASVFAALIALPALLAGAPAMTIDVPVTPSPLLTSTSPAATAAPEIPGAAGDARRPRRPSVMRCARCGWRARSCFSSRSRACCGGCR